MGQQTATATPQETAAAGGRLLGTIEPGPCIVWAILFIVSASLHAAEISITTLYPWKVREFADEEGSNGGPFRYLQEDITKVLTTILILNTASTIVSTVVFTGIAQSSGMNVAKITTALTVVTLFFQELLPKALGVSNAETVARTFMPPLALLATLFAPLSLCFSYSAKKLLAVMGFTESEGDKVTEEELRLLVMGAKESGGIETEEAKMVEGVLDLQDTKISEIMRPRVEIDALECNATLTELLDLVNSTRYSRIPIFEGQIDKIVGVVIAKDMLQFVGDAQELESKTVVEVMEPTFFVPETMIVQKVLEEMRRRRVHMSIVVDEYGGTSGIATLEDILEEIVGNIYDEGDAPEEEEDEDNITMLENGCFEMRGTADLDDVCLALQLEGNDEEENGNGANSVAEDLKEFGTISGFLCSQAGEIPAVGDCILVQNYAFTILDGDERRVLLVHAEPAELMRSRTNSTGTASVAASLVRGADKSPIATPTREANT